MKDEEGKEEIKKRNKKQKTDWRKGKKNKNLKYKKYMKTKTNTSLMDNLQPADVFINHSNSIIVFSFPSWLVCKWTEPYPEGHGVMR